MHSSIRNILLLLLFSFGERSVAQRTISDLPTRLLPASFGPLKKDQDTNRIRLLNTRRLQRGGAYFRTNVNCPANIDFEEGNFNHWVCDTGFVKGVDGFTSSGQPFYSVWGQSSTGLNQVVMTPTPPMATRHEIIANTGGISPLDPYGNFPIYPPDGSNYAIKLGSDLDYPGDVMPMARAERASYVINVPSTGGDFAITYQYAVVFQDPGHVPQNQPRFTVKLYNPTTNNYVNCGSVEYVADSTIPGFELSPIGTSIWYKSWTPVFINLSRYGGQTLYLEFTTEDCAQGGHWGYAYVDVNGCESAITAINDCQNPPRTTLSGPSGFIGYNWWNADYSVLLATTQNATVNAGLLVNQTVHLEIIPSSSSTCRDTLTGQVTQDSLTYSHDSDKNICGDSTVTVGTGLSLQNCTYSWSPNLNIVNANQPVASVRPPVTTDYLLTVENTLNHCKAYDTVRVIVKPLPILSVSSVSTCRGVPVAITVSGANQYTWSPATGISPTSGATVSANPLNTTNYSISGLSTVTGCKKDTVISVTVFDNPSADFSPPVAQCLNGNIFSFSSSSAITTGSISTSLWYFGDGQTATGPNVQHTYINPGVYPVKLVVTSNNGCKDSVTKSITVYAQPTVSIVPNGPLSICSGSNLQLNANVQSAAPISLYQWTNNGNIIPGASGNSITVNQAATYAITVTDINGCVSNGSSVTVIVNPLPQGIVDLPSTNFICEGTAVLLSSPSPAASYQWYVNGNMISGANQSTFNALNPGNYTLELISAAGCRNFANGNISLIIYRKPLVNFSFPEYCRLIPISFINTSDTSQSGPVNWLWDFGDGNSSTIFNPTHTYANGNIYTVQLTVTPTICPALVTTNHQLIHIDTPAPGIRYPTVDAVFNTNTLLHARDNASSYLWMPATGLNNNTLQHPIFNYNNPVEYTIRLIWPTQCVTVDTQLVRIQRAIDIQVPTAFTPNGDNHNDNLDIFLSGIAKLRFFRVFNRWGQLLFETHDPRQLWDGTFKGKKQPAETYVWTAEGLDLNGNTVIRRGQTILIR